jgi:hypothetical protein
MASFADYYDYGYSPGQLSRAGYLNRDFSKLFTSEKPSILNNSPSFERFMDLQSNPESLMTDKVAKHSPGFVLAKMKFGV